MRFAFYGRVSTEDTQDPAASRAWQLRRANELIRGLDRGVVTEHFDLGQSRAGARGPVGRSHRVPKAGMRQVSLSTQRVRWSRSRGRATPTRWH